MRYNLNPLEFINVCNKTQKMCDKAIDIYPSAIKFIPECFLTHEMCDIVTNMFSYIPDRYKTQESWVSCFQRSFFDIILFW